MSDFTAYPSSDGFHVWDHAKDRLESRHDTQEAADERAAELSRGELS